MDYRPSNSALGAVNQMSSSEFVLWVLVRVALAVAIPLIVATLTVAFALMLGQR